MSDPENISRIGLDTIMPEGAAWVPIPGGDFDLFLAATAENIETERLFHMSIAEMRNPQTTPALEDLEIEYGIVANTALTDQQRRDKLEAKKKSRIITGAADELQDRLHRAGFTTLFVHDNDPAANPELLINRFFQMVAGGENGYAGHEGAFAGRLGGEQVVNGLPDDEDETVIIPAGYWSKYFFIGGEATRDGSGFLTNIETVLLPIENRVEIIKTIVEYKPLDTWCGLLIGFE